MNKTHFDTDWQNWIKTNVAAGRDKDGIFKILLDEGFDFLAIAHEMRYVPSRSLADVVNPLAVTAKFDATQMFIPNARRLVESDGYVVDEFLNADECRFLRQTDAAGHDDLMQNLDVRICCALGLDIAYSDDLQLLRVKQGDAIGAPTLGIMGAVTHQVVLYVDAAALQSGALWVVSGDAAPCLAQNDGWLLTKYFYTRAYDGSLNPPMHTKEANEHVPNYTKVGFAKSRISDELFHQITDFYESHLTQVQPEFVAGDFIFNAQSAQQSSVLIDLSAELRQEIHDELHPAMADWCGQDLEPTFVYGIRVYLNQAVLKTHRDRLETHIISAIINVAQDVDEDWTLLIEDNYYRTHQVLLKPGEVVFYEGARLTHGRPTPLNGRAFANIFCHFKPKNYVPLLP